MDLRETFQASGEVRREGSLREWRNGNLHSLVEPTESGHRLHLCTRKGNAQGRLAGGMIFFAMGLFLMLMLAVSRDFMVVMDKTFIVSMFALLGLGSIGITAYQIPRWAEERERQMEAIAARAIARASAPPTATPAHASAPAGRLDLDALEDHADAAQARSPRRTRT